MRSNQTTARRNPVDFTMDDGRPAGGEDQAIAGPRMLLARIIEQAVLDYQMLEAKGFIDHGQLVRGAMHAWQLGIGSRNNNRYAVGRQYFTEAQVDELLTFLRRDVDLLVDLARFNISANVMRQKLGMT
jgi:hypothetical protein